MDAALDYNTSFNDTVSLLEALSEDELQTIQTMAKTLLMLPNDKRPYHPLSEDYLFERVDAGIASADEGNYRPSEEMEADLKKKYNLK